MPPRTSWRRRTVSVKAIFKREPYRSLLAHIYFLIQVLRVRRKGESCSGGVWSRRRQGLPQEVPALPHSGHQPRRAGENYRSNFWAEVVLVPLVLLPRLLVIRLAGFTLSVLFIDGTIQHHSRIGVVRRERLRCGETLGACP